MGYVIDYGQTVVKKSYNTKKQCMNKKSVAIICVIILALSVLFCFRESLYPGDREVTKEALGNMADNIQSGQTIGDAFRAFCEEIITGAEIS